MKTIYFIRHGECEANRDGITAGGELDSPLTALGKEQAKKAGQEIKSKNIELIVCTPLKRTHQTAEIIAREINYDPSKIVENQDFTERGVGVYSGRPYQEYRAHLLNNPNPHPSIETRETLRARVERGLNWLAKQPAQNIVVVSHGATSRILRIILHKLDGKDVYDVEPMGNAEIYKFTLE